MNTASVRRSRPVHKVLYVFELSRADQLSVSPVRAPLAGVIGEITPLSPILLEQDVRPPYLSEDDLYILHDLVERCEWLPGLSWAPVPASAHALFQRVLETGRARWQAPDGVALRESDALIADVYWHLRQDGSQSLRFQLPESEDCRPWRQLPLRPPWMVESDTGICRPIRARAEHDRVLALQAEGDVRPEQAAAVAEAIRGDSLGLPLPRTVVVQPIPPNRPRPCLHLANLELGRAGRFLTRPTVTLFFQYGGMRLNWDEEGDTRLRSDAEQAQPLVLQARRDDKFEESCLRRLECLGLTPLSGIDGLDYPPDAAGLMVPGMDEDFEGRWIAAQRGLMALEEEGWQVERDPDLLAELVEPERWISVLSEIGSDWIELDLQIEWSGQAISVLAAIRDWAANAHPMLVETVCAGADPDAEATLAIDRRRRIQLPRARVAAALNALVELRDTDSLPRDGRLRLRRGRLADLSALKPHWAWRGADGLVKVAQRLARPGELSAMDEPDGLQAELRPYQRLGLGWLQFLCEAGFGGILADDMGLGKTVQTLAHLLTEKRAGRLDRPALVVAPTSLMFNWRAEARRFAPDLKVLLLHGPRRRGDFQWIADSELVLTTYPLLGRDINWLESERFHIVILDEAQAIKNPRTRASRAVRRLQTRHRLCLTGTPLENHLGELWSQFDFLMPGLLGSDRTFRGQFRIPIEQHGSEERKGLLARRIRPFFLRRTKSEVAPELPPKTEIVRSVPLTGTQRRLYDDLEAELRERVRAALAARGPDQGRMVLLDALLRLRQACCDPRLLPDGEGGSIQSSAKLQLLLDLVPELVAEGRRILIFSQFVRMLELIKAELDRLHIPTLQLTGQTRDREAVINAFHRGAAPVFLISLKAGGVGLNLTAADTVIHYDPWWNPAVEDQATDRAHRIGQDQKVFVYRLLTDDTIEERVQQLQEHKRDLIGGLLGGRGAADLNSEELRQLLGAD